MSSWTFFIFPMLKGSPHTSSGLGFPRGSLCCVSGLCSCDGPEVAFRWSERAVLHPGSSASLLSFFPLSRDIFQPALSPRAPRESLAAAPRQVHRRQWVFPPSPGAGDGAPSSQACERISSLSLVPMNAAWYTEHGHCSVTPAAKNDFGFMAGVSATAFLQDLRQEVTYP